MLSSYKLYFSIRLHFVKVYMNKWISGVETEIEFLQSMFTPDVVLFKLMSAFKSDFKSDLYCYILMYV